MIEMIKYHARFQKLQKLVRVEIPKAENRSLLQLKTKKKKLHQIEVFAARFIHVGFISSHIVVSELTAHV